MREYKMARSEKWKLKIEIMIVPYFRKTSILFDEEIWKMHLQIYCTLNKYIFKIHIKIYVYYITTNIYIYIKYY